METALLYLLLAGVLVFVGRGAAQILMARRDRQAELDLPRAHVIRRARPADPPRGDRSSSRSSDATTYYGGWGGDGGSGDGGSGGSGGSY